MTQTESDNVRHLQEEMMMRGLAEIIEDQPPAQEYAKAYDAFIEEHGLVGRIGNKPENIQEAFEDLLERDPRDPK